MLKNVFGHLKTTVGGAALAALQVFVNGANWKQLALAAAMAALGAISKDPGSK